MNKFKRFFANVVLVLTVSGVVTAVMAPTFAMASSGCVGSTARSICYKTSNSSSTSFYSRMSSDGGAFQNGSLIYLYHTKGGGYNYIGYIGCGGKTYCSGTASTPSLGCSQKLAHFFGRNAAGQTIDRWRSAC